MMQREYTSHFVRREEYGITVLASWEEKGWSGNDIIARFCRVPGYVVEVHPLSRRPLAVHLDLESAIDAALRKIGSPPRRG